MSNLQSSLPDRASDATARLQHTRELGPCAPCADGMSPGAFFDRDDVAAQYSRLRNDPDDPAIAVERPIVVDFLGNPKGLEFLDLGCGSAWLGRYLLEQGAKRYLGLDVSHRLLDEARRTLAGTAGEVRNQDLEWWCGAGNIGLFDVVVSRLALQYVRNIAKVFEVVRHHLRPAGLLVFSVEHPVLTASCDRPADGAIGSGWSLRCYFREGERADRWLGAVVLKHHRTIETYINQLHQHGFRIDRFSEGRADRVNFTNDTSHASRLDVPMCIIVRCIRDGPTS
jgi:SAM-dependent methyltransferase